MGAPDLLRSRVGDLQLRHRPELSPEQVLRAIDAHAENARKGRAFCEQWGPGSSVSRILLRHDAGDYDLAVKWNHPRGLRSQLNQWLGGSRADRAHRGAASVAELGIAHAETVALVERRRPGRVVESWLLARFLDGALPLPAAMPALLADPPRRRRIAFAVGRLVGTLHAAGLDHGDFKHSNLLVLPDERVALLDLDSLVPPRRPSWRRRARALGQLEAYTLDLYPELPRSDRARVLHAYLACNPELRPRRRELVEAARRYVTWRLESWAKKDRSDHVYFPLAPREALAPSVVDVRSGAEPSGAPPVGEFTRIPLGG